MQRVKKPKKNGVQISAKERTQIIFLVKKKLYPLRAALFITATKDVVKVSPDDMKKILETVNRYAGFHQDGLVNINDFKGTIEKDIGMKLEDMLKVM